MSVGSIGSAGAPQISQAPHGGQGAGEVKGEKEHDGDADDGGGISAAKSAPPPATVNLSGQKIGQVINTKA